MFFLKLHFFILGEKNNQSLVFDADQEPSGQRIMPETR